MQAVGEVAVYITYTVIAEQREKRDSAFNCNMEEKEKQLWVLFLRSIF